MNEICTILPLKAFARAKSRLCPVTSAAERLNIARCMAEDILGTLRKVPGIGRIVIAGQDPGHAALAAAHGCEYIGDDPALEVSANVARAVQTKIVARAGTLFYVAADLPLLTGEDISALFARHRGGITICRASRDNGTNALLASPPEIASFSFGSGSAARHTAAARSMGCPVRVLDVAAFQRDIDEPADLEWLCDHGKSGATVDYLNGSGIAGRFADVPAASQAS